MPTEFKQATLPNGLTVIAECDPAAHTAAVGYFVRTGARDEASAVMGVSHFLEHMMFKGTAKRSADDVNREFDAMGARANAYTSAEMTAFYAAVLPEYLPAATELLGDMMRPALREDDFNTEKGVILEEIAMYKDDPFWVLYEKTLEEHFQQHPLAHRVLGTNETITNLRVEQMREYFNFRYSADTTTVALAGRVDFDDAVKQIEGLCGRWPRTGAKREYQPLPAADRRFELRDERMTRAYRLMLTEAPPIEDPRRYAAFVLAEILGSHDNSRLHWSLIEPGIAEEAGAAYDGRDGVGDFRVLVACEPAALDEAWAIVEREINDLARSITEKDVEMIRAKVATGVTVSGEKPEGRMDRIGRQWTLTRTYTTLQHELSKIDAVSAEQVRRLLTEFPLRPATIGTLRP